jgi:hypothetical protein
MEDDEKFAALLFLPQGAGRRMIGAGANVNLDIYVNRYSTDAETKTVADALLTGGQEALRKTLEKMDTIGRVSMVGRVGQFELKLIRSRPLPDGGRRIYGVSDRPIQFMEAFNAGSSIDYDIGLMQLDLKPDKKGKESGAGALIYAAKVKVLEGNQLEIENYGTGAAQLRSVRKL